MENYNKIFVTRNSYEYKFKMLQKYKGKFVKKRYFIWNIESTKCWKCQKNVKNGFNENNQWIQIILKVYENDWYKHDDLANCFTSNIRKKSKRYDEPLSQSEYEIKKKNDIVNTMKKRGMSYEDALYSCVRGVNNFRPTVMIAIIKKLFKEHEKIRILDPCGGWGDRLIASMSLNVREYIAFDINKELIPKYEEITEYFKNLSSTKTSFICEPFEKTDVKLLGEFDVVFTSPPFYNLEIYFGVEFNYKSLKEWKEKFLYPFTLNCCQSLKRNGYLILNINSIRKGNKSEDLICLLMDAIKRTKELKYCGVISFAKFYGNKFKSPQPVWIWQKI